MRSITQSVFLSKNIKRTQVLLPLFMACFANAESVTPVDGTTLTVADVQINLLGSAITVSDVAYLGEHSQLGLFEGYEFLFGYEFAEGVILSTGTVDSVIAIQNTIDKSSTTYSDKAVDDDDLGENVYDPAKLSIKFFPSYSAITLDFIFGSEEYNEYVSTDFNDRLEILVNGENCALTPDGEPFSINTVNNRAMYPPLHGTPGESSNPDLYVNNDPGLSVKDSGETESPSVAVFSTEMDGFTKLIQCTAEVTPYEENTLVIGLVDKGDPTHDSWAFFRANSLISTPSNDPIDSDDDGVPDAVEAPDGIIIDTDNDDTPDLFDTDSDNDGIPDSLESPNGVDVDSDGDGLVDRVDLDSDNDGIPDSVEYQGDTDVDQNLDGFADNVTDPIDAQQPVDTDNDGTPDYLDLDSDNDSLSDLFESLPTDTDVDGFDTNNDGMLDDTTDTDNDGLFDVVDPDVAEGTAGEPLVIVDTDNDGFDNYRDTDSDGDTFNDGIENDDFDNDGINDRLQLPSGLETAVSGIGSFGFEILFTLPLLLGFRRLRTRK